MYEVVMRLRPADELLRPVDAPAVDVSGFARVWRDDDECDRMPFYPVGGATMYTPYSTPAHRVEWQPAADGSSFRMAVAAPSAEQVAELQRLASVNPLDEWHGSDAYADLAAAVLRVFG